MDILEKYNEEEDKSDTGVQFQEHRAERYYPETPKIIQWMMKYSGGLAKDEKQASYVLLGFVAVAIIITLFLIFGSGDTRPPISPNDLRLTPPSGAVPR